MAEIIEYHLTKKKHTFLEKKSQIFVVNKFYLSLNH